jgi:dipeptidyl-peptidase-4
MINNTDSIYPKIIPVQYPKAGTTNSACKIGVVTLENRETIWIKIPGESRNNYLARMKWAYSSDELIIQQLNRLQNKNSIYIADASTGNAKNIYTEKNNTWLKAVNNVKFLFSGNYFTWISDKSGWNHIYLIAKDGNEVKNVTSGEYDVIELIGIDETTEYVYFIASPENPTQRYLYRSSLNSSEPPVRITPIIYDGYNSYSFSPNFRWAVHTYSKISNPGSTRLIAIPDHETIVTFSANEKLQGMLEDLKISEAEFFKIEIANQISLDAYRILPFNFDEGKKYPVLFYVYGEPGSQTVLDRWSKRYIWHQMLAQNGIIIISVDNRGTPAPKGRDFRKCVYGKKGIISSHDQSEAAKQIMKWKFVDRERIGIWGWSGGGAMTLNMLFRYPDIYKLGVAVAPVTDLRLYDTIYEERYMGLPSENVEAYKLGSPITFAHKLNGDLLLVHGTADDNVHYQNSELLVNELIKHNKKFTFLPYPNRTHGISEGKGTRHHLYKNITDFILNNL